MSLFTRRRPAAAVPVAPPTPVLESTAAGQLIEAQARLEHAAQLVDELLADCRRRDDRGPLRDGLLELRQAVNPAPALPLRPAVPVIPGRTT